ncbi:MAG TPA: globin domain-containing protein, partial [Ferruginibacter sp.]|nr:globin domain-containing protein [Ferruginibacter sp.]
MESKYTKLTAQQIQLIRRSWRSLRGINPVLLADIFYAKLFSDTPRLRKLFPKDMQPQYGKLVDMLNKMILQLDNPSMLEQEIEDLSRRHMEYGVRPA